MIELLNDTVRRQMLQAVGGFNVSCARGTFLAVFDNDYAAIGDGSVDVGSSSPRLTCVTSDVETLQLQDGDWLRIGDDGYLFRHQQRDGDDAGFSLIQLHDDL